MKKSYLVTMVIIALCAPNPGFTQETENEYIRSFKAMFPKGELSEDDVYRTDRLLVSATGSQKPVHLAPSVATVITAEDIEKTGATNLDEVLETVPGLHVAPSGLNIFSSTWSIRGMRTSINQQVLLLINGIPLTDTADGGRTKTFKMPVTMISRVEVIRGPGSAIHGADAFNGTINVITKDGHDVDGTNVGVRYGSFNTVDGWIQHGKNYGSWNVVASLEARKTDGDDNRIVNQDALGSGSPSLTPTYLDTSANQIDLHLGVNKDDRWIGHVYGLLIDDNGMGAENQTITHKGTINNQQFLFDLTYHNKELIEDLDFNMVGSYLYMNNDLQWQFAPSSVLNARSNPIVTNYVTSLEANGLYNAFARHQIRLATGVKNFTTKTDQYSNLPSTSVPPRNWFGSQVNISGTSDFFMENQNRFLWYLSLQDEWDFARGWDLTAGVRYDDYSDFGSTVNPRLALVWETRYDLTSKLMYGRAFRAPSFIEQHIENNPVLQGNQNLKPETIDTFELAFDWQPTKDLRIVPSFFYYETEGIIQYTGSLPSKAENYAALQGQGFELEANWQIIDNLQLKANLAYQHSKNKDTDERIPDTPEWQIYTEANWVFLPEWNLNGQWFWIGERHRAEGDPRMDIDDYNLVNLTLKRKNIVKHWDVALSARNLFDQDAREPSPYDPTTPAGALIPGDYPLEGRAILGEIRFHF